MLNSKQTNLKPLLESQNGLHLTIYLVNENDLKSKLRAVIDQSHELLRHVKSLEERLKFLKPLENLLLDKKIFEKIKGNVGIFRNENSFRVLSIPIEIEDGCHIATSFHVKPILRWLQGDEEFLLLGLEKGSAHLYIISQLSLKLVDSIFFPESMTHLMISENSPTPQGILHQKVHDSQLFTWIDNWITGWTSGSATKLFMAGDLTLIEKLQKMLRHKNIMKTPIAPFFSRDALAEICQSARKVMLTESASRLEKALLEFRIAEDDKRATKNLFQISKAVVKGKVKKLIVTDEVSIFGKIDHLSGGVAIHPLDLDHEDDCLLDDLAQMVLRQGGEVVIARRDEMPKGRPILAILHETKLAPIKTEDTRSKSSRRRLG